MVVILNERAQKKRIKIRKKLIHWRKAGEKCLFGHGKKAPADGAPRHSALVLKWPTNGQWRPLGSRSFFASPIPVPFFVESPPPLMPAPLFL
jgi:hypothetical protein